jgi:hypothetical protein
MDIKVEELMSILVYRGYVKEDVNILISVAQILGALKVITNSYNFYETLSDHWSRK